jgi:predicted PurR-regulated permease PerM
VGLSLLGIPAALLLGLTGALLTFIPYIGAILAAVPAVLVALTSSPGLALLTALMFWGVHTIEGTFITPVVQDEEVYLPAVTTIFSTLGCAVLFGPSGVVVASPLVLVVMTAVRMFYLEDVLGEPPQAPPPPRRSLFARRPPVTEPRHAQPSDTA